MSLQLLASSMTLQLPVSSNGSGPYVLPIRGLLNRPQYRLSLDTGYRSSDLREVSFLLVGKAPDGFALVGPLPVSVVRDTDGWYLAQAPEVPIHGDGPSIDEAIGDYRECLVEYFELVEAGTLAGNLYDKVELERIGKIVKRTEAS
jgi:hypothetical protein